MGPFHLLGVTDAMPFRTTKNAIRGRALVTELAIKIVLHVANKSILYYLLHLLLCSNQPMIKVGNRHRGKHS